MFELPGAREVFHWGYVVPDMDRALRAWPSARVVVPPAVDPIQNVCCSLLVYRDSVAIELVAPLPEGRNPLASRLRRGGGLDHVCFFANDLAADLSSLVADGGKTVVPPTYGAVFDRTLAFVVTGSGLLVELMSKEAERRAASDPLEAFFRLQRGC